MEISHNTEVLVSVGKTGLEIRSLEGYDNWTDLGHSHFLVLLCWGLTIPTKHPIVGMFSKTALICNLEREHSIGRAGIGSAQVPGGKICVLRCAWRGGKTRYWQWGTKERILQRWRVNFCWRLFLTGISINRLLLIVSSSNRSSIVISSIASRKKKRKQNFFHAQIQSFWGLQVWWCSLKHWTLVPVITVMCVLAYCDRCYKHTVC